MPIILSAVNVSPRSLSSGQSPPFTSPFSLIGRLRRSIHTYIIEELNWHLNDACDRNITLAILLHFFYSEDNAGCFCESTRGTSDHKS